MHTAGPRKLAPVGERGWHRGRDLPLLGALYHCTQCRIDLPLSPPLNPTMIYERPGKAPILTRNTNSVRLYHYASTDQLEQGTGSRDLVQVL